MPKLSAFDLQSVAHMHAGLIRPSVQQIPAMNVPQIGSDVEFATWEAVDMYKRFEESEAQINRLGALENIAPLDSSTSDLSRIVIEKDTVLASASDPVVDAKGIKRWILPLAKDSGTIKESIGISKESKMTLDNLLEMLGIFNHPFKRLVYNDKSGNKYILKDGVVVVTDEGFREIKGKESLSLALKIVGYDTDSVYQQFFGDEPCLKIENTLISDMVEIPPWLLTKVVDLDYHYQLLLTDEYTDVVELLLDLDYLTGHNIILSIKNEEHVQRMGEFVDKVFNPLKQAFTQKYYQNLGDIKNIYETGLQNILKNHLLSRGKINELKNKFDQFDEAKYREFVMDKLYTFKFKDIIDASFNRNLRFTFHKAIAKMCFKYIGYEINLKTLTHETFMSEIESFINSFSKKQFRRQFTKEFLRSDRKSDLFLILAEYFMTTEYDEDIGEMIGKIARNPSTFHGWIGEVGYLFNKFIGRVIPTLIEANWNLDGIKMFQWTERNPKYASRLKAQSFTSILKDILGGRGLSQNLVKNPLRTAQRIINGFDTSIYMRLIAQGREGDIASMLIPGSSLTDLSTWIVHTHEVKTIRSNPSSNTLSQKPKDISRDIVSLLIDISEMWFLTEQYMKYGEIQGFRQRSEFGSGIYGLADGKFHAESTIGYIFKDTKSTLDLKGKGALNLQLYHKVASKLNDYIIGKTFSSVKAVKAEILKVLNNDKVKEQIKGIASEIYGRSSIGWDNTKWDILKKFWENEYEKLIKLFDKKFDNILVQFPNDEYKLVWEDSIAHSFVKLKEVDGKWVPDTLYGGNLVLDPNFFGIIKFDHASKQWDVRDPTQIGLFETFDVPMVVIHDLNNPREWGLIRSDELRYFKQGTHSFALGFNDPTGDVHSGVILNTKEGYILEGQVALENNRLQDRGKLWYEDYLTNTQYFTEIEDGFMLANFYRNIMYTTGKWVSALLQPCTYNFVAESTYEPFFKEEGIQQKNKLKELIGQYGVTINPDRYLVQGMSNRINALLSFLYQIGGEFTMQRVMTGVPRIFVSQHYLNCFSSQKDRYSIPLYKKTLAALRPLTNDPLYSDPNYDPNYDPSHDSSSPIYWLNLLSRSYIDGDERKIRVINNEPLKMKQFYNAWLKLIQNDLARVNPSGLFERYRGLLEGESFTTGVELLIDETGQKVKNDFELIDDIDIALQDIFGWNIFTDLLSGVLSFSEDSSGEFTIDWILHKIGVQSKLISDNYFGIGTLASVKYTIREGYLYTTRKIIEGNSYTMSSWYFSNIKLNGFRRTLSGKRVTISGTYKIGDYRLDTIPEDHSFLDNYFSAYNHLNFRQYSKAINIFLHNEFSELLDQKWMDKKNVIGRGRIQELFYRRIKSALVPNLMLFTKQFVNDPESWYIRTEKMAQSFVRTFVDDPTLAFDFARQLREILFSGEDGWVTLDASLGGRTKYVSPQGFAGNELIGEGLDLFIPYEEAMDYIDDIWFTLNFYAGRKPNVHTHISSPDSKYHLDIDLLLANLDIKMINMFREYYDLFSQGPCDDYKIIFTTEKGRGIGQSNLFSRTYSTLRFSEDQIIFNRADKQKFQEAVASMVFYLVFIPNAFVVVKAGVTSDINQYNFFYADVFGLYSHDYVQSSDYAVKNKYKGQFIWTDTQGQYTFENYKNWQQEFEVIFGPEDIRLFLAFSNREGRDIIDYLMDWFNYLLVRHRRDSMFNRFRSIVDLRS